LRYRYKIYKNGNAGDTNATSVSGDHAWLLRYEKEETDHADYQLPQPTG